MAASTVCFAMLNGSVLLQMWAIGISVLVIIVIIIIGEFPMGIDVHLCSSRVESVQGLNVLYQIF